MANLCKIQQKDAKLHAQQASQSQLRDTVLIDALVILKLTDIWEYAIIDAWMQLLLVLLIILPTYVWLLALLAWTTSQIRYQVIVYSGVQRATTHRLLWEHALHTVWLDLLIIWQEAVLVYVQLQLSKPMEILQPIAVFVSVLMEPMHKT